jgi:hypothetical protein
MLALAEPSGAWQVFPWSPRPAPRLDNAATIEAITWSGGLFTLAIFALVGCYATALAALRGGSTRTLTIAVFAFGAVFQIQQLDSPALLSSDPFSYLMYGRVAAVHGANPYVDTPDGFADDPVLPFVYWKHVPSFYGPLWTALSTGPALAAGDNVGLGVLLLRSIAAAAALSCGALIWLALKPTAAGAAATAAALWLWNPLVALEAGMSGHNDVLLVAFLVAAFVCARSGRAVAAGALWAAAAFTKAVAILILPILAWSLIRHNVRSDRRSRHRLAAAALGGMALVALGILALGRSPLEGSSVGSLGADTERYTNSLHEIVLAAVRLGLGDDPDDVRTPLYFRPWDARSTVPTGLWTSSGESRRLISSLPLGSALLVTAPAERGWRRVAEPINGRVGYVPADRLPATPQEQREELVVGESTTARWSDRGPLRTANGLVRIGAYAVFGLCVIWIAIAISRGTPPAVASTTLFLSFLLATATWIWPWYLLWPLAFAVLGPPSRAVRLTLLLSVSSLLIYPLFGYQGTEAWWAFNFRSLVVWLVPTLLFLVWECRSRVRNRRFSAAVSSPLGR